MSRQKGEQIFRTEEQLEYEKFLELDQILRECSENALKIAEHGWCFQEKIDNPKNEFHEDVIEEEIEKLIEIYKESYFAEGTDDNYQLGVMEKFRTCVDAEHLDLHVNCVNQEHLKLILPIIFFSLIVQNESNPGAIDRRTRTDRSWQKMNPYAPLYGIKSKKGSDDIPAINAFRGRKVISTEETEFNEKISDFRKWFDSNKNGISKYMSLEFLSLIEDILSLENRYDYVIAYLRYVKAGCLLYDILSKTHVEGRSLDTILRLYMAKNFYDMLAYTEHMTNGNLSYEFFGDGQGILEFYYSQLKKREGYEHMCRVTNKEYDTGMVTFSEFYPIAERLYTSTSNRAKKKLYYVVYPKLQTSVDVDFSDWSNIFFNKKELSKHVNVKEIIFETVDSIIGSKGMGILPTLQKISENAHIISTVANLCGFYKNQDDDIDKENECNFDSVIDDNITG